MPERPASPSAPDRTLSIQPVVNANGACWRRQAMSVVSGSPTSPTAAAAPGDGPSTSTSPSGDGRSPQQAKS